MPFSAIRHVINERKGLFRQHSLWNSYTISRGIESYVIELPEFRDKSFIRHLEHRLASGPVSVLDLGCGWGHFLAELSERYPDVRPYGISTFDYRTGSMDRFKKAAVIDYRVGDAHRLARIFPSEKFDFIFSVFTFLYLADPLNVLRQCYAALNLGGMIFANHVQLSTSTDDVERLERFWNTQGVESYISGLGLYTGYCDFDLCMRKLFDRKLPVPFSYRKTNHDSWVEFDGARRPA